MGLNIDGDLVDVDHSHNQLLNTGLRGNPVVQYVPGENGEITVYSVFRRQKAPNSLKRNRDTRLRGDNCHLLYALKGRDGLQTTFGAIRRLMMHFDEILEQIIDQSGVYDAILPMPSSHTISHIFAERLARRYGCAVHNDLFEKISWDRARELLTASPLSSPEKRSVAGRLASGDGKFSLKEVPPRYRDHFPPLTLKRERLPLGCTRFLLADDLLATGKTLVTARNEILAAVPGASVDASCIFSQV